jgi:hypothetical protein
LGEVLSAKTGQLDLVNAKRVYARMGVKELWIDLSQCWRNSFGSWFVSSLVGSLDSNRLTVTRFLTYQNLQAESLDQFRRIPSSADQTFFWLQKLQSLQEYCLASPLTG